MAELSRDFRLEWHGNTLILRPSGGIETLPWDLVESAAELVLEPLRAQDIPMVVVDLADVSYFGSVFLAFLLRCHKHLKSRGGELVVCGASEPAAELLRVTALDTIWAIYDTKEEAVDALSS